MSVATDILEVRLKTCRIALMKVDVVEEPNVAACLDALILELGRCLELIKAAEGEE